MPITFADLKQRRKNYVDEPVPEWGGDVRLQRLAADEVLAIRNRHGVSSGGGNLQDEEAVEFGLDLLGRSIVNEHGELQFDSPEAKRYLRSDLAVFTRLINAAITLNGLDAKVSAAKKNSTTQPGKSPGQSSTESAEDESSTLKIYSPD